MDVPQNDDEEIKPQPAEPQRRGWLRDYFTWLLAKGRSHRMARRSEAQVGALVDAFAAFATLDDVLSAVEADLILDMLRSAFPDVDHAWFAIDFSCDAFKDRLHDFPRAERPAATARPGQRIATKSR